MATRDPVVIESPYIQLEMMIYLCGTLAINNHIAAKNNVMHDIVLPMFDYCEILVVFADVAVGNQIE